MKSRIQNQEKPKNKLTVFDRIMIGVLIAVMIFITYEIIIFFVANRNVGFEYKPYDKNDLKITYNIKNCPYNSKMEIKKDIDNLFGNTPYIYIECDLGDTLGGLASPIVRSVKIHNTLSLYEYTFDLAHELIHITHCTMNETYTQFEAFKMLYESGNEWFKNCALWEVKYRMGSGTVYDFGYYVIEYLGLKEK